MTKQQFLKKLKKKKEEFNKAIELGDKNKISNEIFKMIFISEYNLTEKQFCDVCANLIVTSYTFYLFYTKR